MIKMTKNIFLNESELKITFVCASGPGGQNVNKVATAAQLRFNVIHSPAIPEPVRARLIAMIQHKLTYEGDLIIKASRYRTQERNKQDAIERLKELIQRAAIAPKKRKKTKPTKTSVEKRLENKKLHGKTKLLRRKPASFD